LLPDTFLQPPTMSAATFVTRETSGDGTSGEIEWMATRLTTATTTIKCKATSNNYTTAKEYRQQTQQHHPAHSEKQQQWHHDAMALALTTAFCPPLCQQWKQIYHISKRRNESSRDQEQLQASTRVALATAQQCGQSDSNKDSKNWWKRDLSQSKCNKSTTWKVTIGQGNNNSCSGVGGGA